MERDAMILRTERLELRELESGDVEELQAYLAENRDWLRPWEPLRDESYFSLEAAGTLIAAQAAEREAGRAAHWGIFPRDGGRLAGTVGLTGIVRGAFLSCWLGYKLNARDAGRGMMAEALGAVIGFAFRDLGLHRVEANVMPRNEASRRVLAKLGFAREGMSPRYLRIAGAWEDHERYALLNEEEPCSE